MFDGHKVAEILIAPQDLSLSLPLSLKKSVLLEVLEFSFNTNSVCITWPVFVLLALVSVRPNYYPINIKQCATVTTQKDHTERYLSLPLKKSLIIAVYVQDTGLEMSTLSYVSLVFSI